MWGSIIGVVSPEVWKHYSDNNRHTHTKTHTRTLVYICTHTHTDIQSSHYFISQDHNHTRERVRYICALGSPAINTIISLSGGTCPLQWRCVFRPLWRHDNPTATSWLHFQDVSQGVYRMKCRTAESTCISEHSCLCCCPLLQFENAGRT